MASPSDLFLFDAGVFIGALLRGDKRHAEAWPLVNAAREGVLSICTTTGILSEVYAALTWIKAKPRHSPMEAANAVRLLAEPPSAIEILPDSLDAALKMLELAEKHHLTARRIHDARHAATALVANVRNVVTYDGGDWKNFSDDGFSGSHAPHGNQSGRHGNFRSRVPASLVPMRRMGTSPGGTETSA
ncbi:MAG: type II toxin-antitoxin system VapC family toxin, partial [Gammaproteobacteria bacterium]|nr:type II toxin-antitoxin system VapC family toxin [Gammaproteobacteria bacterium]